VLRLRFETLGTPLLILSHSLSVFRFFVILRVFSFGGGGEGATLRFDSAGFVFPSPTGRDSLDPYHVT
jgi:hypothetical protein